MIQLSGEIVTLMDTVTTFSEINQITAQTVVVTRPQIDTVASIRMVIPTRMLIQEV
jgi:hypothetical protein